jgi:arylsulfatase
MKPNILFIITDQQRGDCLGIEGHPALLTPNMDSLAGNGARFRRAYSTCPVCIPARRSLLSGQFPATNGLCGYQDGHEWDATHSLPEVLRRAGYQTYLAGRDMHQYPVRKRYGYDHMVIMQDYRRWLDRQVPVDTYQPEGHYLGDYYSSGVMSSDWTARSWHLDESLHQTNWTVNEAMKFLQTRDPTCPFFLTVSFIAPHPPLIPPAFYMDRYLRANLPAPAIGDWATPPDHDGLGYGPEHYRVNLQGEALRSTRAGYYGLINHVDDQIGRLLSPFTGIDPKDTMIIFTSDHGEMLGDHYMWRKNVPYEGSARIPLLISAPERFGFTRRNVRDEPVCLEDILPTILDVAGVDCPAGVDGRSLVPLLRGEQAEWREFVHIEHTAGWQEGDLAHLAHHTLTDGKEKYIWFAQDGGEQFFDLREDPAELRNLAGDPGAQVRVSAWRDRLIDHLTDRLEGFSDGARLIPGRGYPIFQKQRLKSAETPASR